MQPISFPEANANLTKPENMTADQCGSLPAYQGIDHEGFPIFISCFKLNDEEMLKILETGRVWLRVYGQTHPPVSLDVSNPWGK